MGNERTKRVVDISCNQTVTDKARVEYGRVWQDETRKVVQVNQEPTEQKRWREFVRDMNA